MYYKYEKRYLTFRRLSDIKNSSHCISYLLQIVPELYTIPLLGFFNLSKNDIFKTVHGTCFTSTLVARIPKSIGVLCN